MSGIGKKDKMSMSKLLSMLAVAVVVTSVLMNLPDIKRYVKMSTM